MTKDKEIMMDLQKDLKDYVQMIGGNDIGDMGNISLVKRSLSLNVKSGNRNSDKNNVISNCGVIEVFFWL